jgi:hypothetical protein
MTKLIIVLVWLGIVAVGVHLTAERIADAMDDSANRIAEAGRTR